MTDRDRPAPRAGGRTPPARRRAPRRAPPPEVVARLDATLASLAAERRRADRPTTHRSRRRPRRPPPPRWPASACWPPPRVVVAGVALGAGPSPRRGAVSTPGSAADGDSRHAARELSDDGAGSAGLAARSRARAPGDGERAEPPSRRRRTRSRPTPTLFAGDVDLDDELLLARDEPPARRDVEPGHAVPAATATCAATGRGRLRPWREVDGTPSALVVFRRADGRASWWTSTCAATRPPCARSRCPRPDAPRRAGRNAGLRSVEDVVRQHSPSDPAGVTRPMSQTTEPRNVIIIGSGPAGLHRRGVRRPRHLEPLVFEGSVTAGGALMNTTEVENFPGFRDGIMGPALMDEMRAQAERFGAELISDDVVEVDLTGDIKVVKTADRHLHRARR